MRIRYLEWDSANSSHIARHRVQEKEVEELCMGKFCIRRGKDKRYVFLGRSFSGRYLFLVMRSLGAGVFRPVTARDMSTREKEFYRKKVKQ
jgi:uncharacterized DUF497 family protein